MKKTAFLSLCVLATTSLAVPIKPSAIITPSMQLTETACIEGYTDATNNQDSRSSKYLFRLIGSIDDGYSVQSTQGYAYSVCDRAGRELLDRPVTKTIAPILTVYVAGPTQGAALDEAKTWSAALSFRTADGKEVARFQPTTQSEGNTNFWKRECVPGSCVWRGMNTYIFEMNKMPADLKKKALTAATVTVLVSAGAGIETYPLDSNQLNQF